MKHKNSFEHDQANHFSRLDPQAAEKLAPSDDEDPRGGRSRTLEWILFSIFGAMLLLGGFALYTTVSPRWKEVPNRIAEGIEQDRVNILLLGVGGESHPGGGDDLADTIIVASLRPSTREAALISIPRDLYVEIGQYGTHRINRTHQIGETSGYPGGGPALAMDTVGEIIDVPIHAYAKVDFEGFEEIIDSLGGVEIDVERGFHDFLFDDTFDAGLQTMSGKRALQFARYRYIRGELGNNFAREDRQRKVLRAVQQKIREKASGNPVEMMKLARSLSSHTETNLTLAQIADLYRTFRTVSEQELVTVSLEPVTEPFEVRSISGAGEAVRPKTGDFREIRRLAHDVFASHDPTELAERQIAERPALRSRTH